MMRVDSHLSLLFFILSNYKKRKFSNTNLACVSPHFENLRETGVFAFLLFYRYPKNVISVCLSRSVFYEEEEWKFRKPRDVPGTSAAPLPQIGPGAITYRRELQIIFRPLPWRNNIIWLKKKLSVCFSRERKYNRWNLYKQTADLICRARSKTNFVWKLSSFLLKKIFIIYSLNITETRLSK